jgi:uncharacterized protein (TIGR02611 family)
VTGQTSLPGRLKRRWARWRDQLRERPRAEFVYRAVLAVTGLAVLAVGILAIPYPGPGWAIVFLGLAILATEFAWASHLLAHTRRRYDAVMVWFGRQGIWVRAAGVTLTTAVVLATLWMLGAVGWSAGLVGVDQPWLQSPLGLGGG